MKSETEIKWYSTNSHIGIHLFNEGNRIDKSQHSSTHSCSIQ